jgi:hypothetical protein
MLRISHIFISTVDSSVSRGLDDRKYGIIFLARTSYITVHHRVRTSSGAHPASCIRGVGASLFEHKAERASSWRHPSSSEVKNAPPYAFMASCVITHAHYLYDTHWRTLVKPTSKTSLRVYQICRGKLITLSVIVLCAVYLCLAGGSSQSFLNASTVCARNIRRHGFTLQNQSSTECQCSRTGHNKIQFAGSFMVCILKPTFVAFMILAWDWSWFWF